MGIPRGKSPASIRGNVVAWGCGQLGRRIIERNSLPSLNFQGMGIPRGKIACFNKGEFSSSRWERRSYILDTLKLSNAPSLD
ncbi:hypothetical protein NHJ13734_008226 [Beauveria thailandica]